MRSRRPCLADGMDLFPLAVVLIFRGVRHPVDRHWVHLILRLLLLVLGDRLDFWMCAIPVKDKHYVPILRRVSGAARASGRANLARAQHIGALRRSAGARRHQKSQAAATLVSVLASGVFAKNSVVSALHGRPPALGGMHMFIIVALST